MKTSMS